MACRCDTFGRYLPATKRITGFGGRFQIGNRAHQLKKGPGMRSRNDSVLCPALIICNTHRFIEWLPFNSLPSWNLQDHSRKTLLAHTVEQNSRKNSFEWYPLENVVRRPIPAINITWDISWSTIHRTYSELVMKHILFQGRRGLSHCTHTNTPFKRGDREKGSFVMVLITERLRSPTTHQRIQKT